MDIIIKKSLVYKSILSIFISLIVLTSCTVHYKSSEKFNTLMEILDNEYIKELNSSKLTDDAIQTVFSKLDKHSIYLDSNDLENYLISTKGEYGGIGISMYLNKSILTIMYTYPGSPAQKFGILPGDIILKINHHPTLGLSIDACSNLAKGKVDEILYLTIIRKSEKRPLLFEIKRKKIKTDPLKSKKFTGNILYVKIPIFNESSSTELKKILKKNTHLQGIILDLRSNPGGILNQAVSIVDMFIDKGLIVSQKGRKKRHTKQFIAHKRNTDTQTQLAILIDSASASASEIVAGALKVHKRATIIGEKSFGKGSVQALFSLDKTSAIKLTIAKYYLPNGKCIANIGISPHVRIKSHNLISKNRYIVSEKKLKRIVKKLENGSLKLKTVKKMKYKESTPDKIKMDKVLKKALQILVDNGPKN